MENTIHIPIVRQETIPADIPVNHVFIVQYGNGHYGLFLNRFRAGGLDPAGVLTPDSNTYLFYQDLIARGAYDGELILLDESYHETAARMIHNPHYLQSLDDEGNFVFTLQDDTHDRHESAQVHNAPTFAMLDGTLAFENNMARALSKIEDSIIQFCSFMSAVKNGNTAGYDSAISNMETLLREYQKIDLSRGQEYRECAHAQYRIHNAIMSRDTGLHNTEKNHIYASIMARHIVDCYFGRILTSSISGEKRHDVAFRWNGLESRGRLATHNDSFVRQAIIDELIVAIMSPAWGIDYKDSNQYNRGYNRQGQPDYIMSDECKSLVNQFIISHDTTRESIIRGETDGFIMPADNS